jgi:hypothetical protein
MRSNNALFAQGFNCLQVKRDFSTVAGLSLACSELNQLKQFLLKQEARRRAPHFECRSSSEADSKGTRPTDGFS